MKKLIVTGAMILLLSLISCSKNSGQTYEVSLVEGVKIVKNSSEPANSGFKPELLKIYETSGENADTTGIWKKPLTFTIDENGNVYVLDLLAGNLKKYDAKGNFVKSIGNKGQGPGELYFPNSLSIYKDTIMVCSSGSRKMVKFDLDGNHLNDKPLGATNPQLLNGLDNGNFIGLVQSFNQQKMEIAFNIELLNSNLERVKVLKEKNLPVSQMQNLELLDLLTPYTGSANLVALPLNSEDKYQIDLYDANGKKIIQLNKNYRKLNLGKEERDEFDKAMAALTPQGVQPKSKAKFKKAVNKVLFDSKDNVWVFPSLERDSENKDKCYVDVFNKEGIFQNRVLFPDLKSFDYINLGYSLRIKNNVLYVLDENENKLIAYRINYNQ